MLDLAHELSPDLDGSVCDPLNDCSHDFSFPSFELLGPRVWICDDWPALVYSDHDAAGVM